MTLKLVAFPDHFNNLEHVYVNPRFVTAVYKEDGHTVIRLQFGGQPAVDTPVSQVADLLTRTDADR